MTSQTKVEFYRHAVGEEERAAVAEALEGPFLTTGRITSEFERELGQYLGDGIGALGVSSCTAAMHLALLAHGIGPGDEVITTPMTFIATGNVILHAGATPVFADVDPATGLIDPGEVEAAITKRTRAVIAVHLYGLMADVVRLRSVCDAHGLVLIEDAAHALESRRDATAPGQLGDAACFSFYATKNITSGEGGALASRDPAVLERARILSQHGMSKNAALRHSGNYQHWDMLELGYKYNMTNLQAAMLRPQLRRVDRQLALREAVARRYEEALGALQGVRTQPSEQPRDRHARHLFVAWVPDRRDDYLDALGKRGIGVAVNYRAIHLLGYYRQRFGFEPGAFPVAERLGDSCLSLPHYPTLPEADQRRVIDAFAEIHHELSRRGALKTR